MKVVNNNRQITYNSALFHLKARDECVNEAAAHTDVSFLLIGSSKAKW